MFRSLLYPRCDQSITTLYNPSPSVLLLPSGMTTIYTKAEALNPYHTLHFPLPFPRNPLQSAWGKKISSYDSPSRENQSPTSSHITERSTPSPLAFHHFIHPPNSVDPYQQHPFSSLAKPYPTNTQDDTYRFETGAYILQQL